jgi:hypothetical protein
MATPAAAEGDLHNERSDIEDVYAYNSERCRLKAHDQRVGRMAK